MYRRPGVTLVEMLIAVGLIMGIMVLLAEVFRQGQEAMQSLRGISELETRLRHATTVLRRDLAEDHFDARRRPSDPNFWQMGPPRQGFFRVWQGLPHDAGTATSGSTTTLVDSTRSGANAWVSNQWRNATLRITAGTGAGNVLIVSSNTGNTLTYPTANPSFVPDATTRYALSFNYVSEGPDGDGIHSYRAVDHGLHFSVKLRGNSPVRWMSARVPLNSPLLTALTNSDPTLSSPTAKYQESNSVYNSQWGEVAYWLNRTGGSATGGTTSSLQDTTKSWLPNQWAGWRVRILSGIGAGSEMTIISNTANAITYAAQSFTPNASTKYEIWSGNTAGGTPLYTLYRTQYVVVPDTTPVNYSLQSSGKWNQTDYSELSTIDQTNLLYFNGPEDLAGADRGVATTGTTATLRDTSKAITGAWTPNRWENFRLRITGGPGVGGEIPILSNTADTLTYSTQSFTPTTSTTYAIVGRAFDPNRPRLQAASVLLNDVISFQVQILRPGDTDFVDVPPIDPAAPATFVYDSSGMPNPPYTILAVRITLRIWDNNTQQARQITLIQDI